MGNFVSSRDFYQVLEQYLDFPEGVTAFVVRGGVDKPVTIEFTLNAKTKDGIPTGEVYEKQFNLVEIEDDTERSSE